MFIQITLPTFKLGISSYTKCLGLLHSVSNFESTLSGFVPGPIRFRNFKKLAYSFLEDRQRAFNFMVITGDGNQAPTGYQQVRLLLFLLKKYK